MILCVEDCTRWTNWEIFLILVVLIDDSDYVEAYGIAYCTGGFAAVDETLMGKVIWLPLQLLDRVPEKMSMWMK